MASTRHNHRGPPVDEAIAAMINSTYAPPTYQSPSGSPDSQETYTQDFDFALLPTEGGLSPFKQFGPPITSSPTRAVFGQYASVCLPPPSPAVHHTDGIVKQPYTQAYDNMTKQPMPALFTAFQPLHGHKSNAVYSDNVAEFPPSDAHTISDSILGHPTLPIAPQSQEISVFIPEPEDMPVIEDDGKKPPYSYAQLIAMAILRGPRRRLTLNKIYEWILDTFAWYHGNGDEEANARFQKGWQNSIRHNLSLNKSFEKIERPKNDPGKGNYWGVQPGHEAQFLKEKHHRRPASTGETLKSGTSQSIKEPESAASFIQPEIKKADLPTIEEPKLCEDPESDATIPASDPDLFDDMPPPALPPQYSSPAHAIDSSPPVIKGHTNVSPGLGRDITSSAIAGRSTRKRGWTDSGYHSSINSSAKRPQTAGPPNKRHRADRAEAEISRLRSSSRDISPARRYGVQGETRALLSSSPVHNDSSMTLPSDLPITPGYYRRAIPPPESTSPGTMLEDHRKRVASMIEPKFEDSPCHYSPFRFDDHEFPIFNDSPSRIGGVSPVKQSAKRPGLARSTTMSALADITGTSQRLNLMKNRPDFSLGSSLKQKSPPKSPTKNSWLPTNVFQDPIGLDDLGLFGGPPSDGLDLMGGFGNIGDQKENRLPVDLLSPSMATKSHPKRVQGGNRPALGARSNTWQR